MRRILILSAASVIITPSVSKAAIVNVLPDIEAPRTKHRSAAAVDFETGNNNVLNVSLGQGTTLKVREDLLFHAVATYSRNGGRKTASNGHSSMVHIRTRYALKNWLGGYVRAVSALNDSNDIPGVGLLDYLSMEIYSQHEWDHFRNLDTRALTGAGPVIDIIRLHNLDTVMGISYMFEYINGYKPNREERNHRLSSYIQTQMPINDNVSINNVEFSQMKFNDTQDYILLSDTTFRNKFNKWCSIETEFKISYDSKPLASVKKLDVALLVLITAEFLGN